MDISMKPDYRSKNKKVRAVCSEETCVFVIKDVDLGLGFVCVWGGWSQEGERINSMQWLCKCNVCANTATHLIL